MKVILYVFIFYVPFAFAVEPEGQGWIHLFNGKSFEGWHQYGGKHEYKVLDSMIVGTAVAKEPNGFMTTKEKYKDFELVFEVKIDYPLNSGCQIRSIPYGPIGHLMGPQVEIAARQSGFIYGEHMKKADGKTKMGWLSPDIDTANLEKKKKALKRDQWNKFRIMVKDNHYQTYINDVLITDFKFDGMNEAAHIGLQVHSSEGDIVGKSVRWKNIKLRQL